MVFLTFLFVDVKYMIENVYPTEIVSFLLFQSMVSYLWKHPSLSLRLDDWGRSLILEHKCIRLHVVKSKCYFTTLSNFIFSVDFIAHCEQREDL